MADTTLTAAQDENDELAYVAGAGPREADFLIQIDSEYEFVEWRGNQFARPWQVQRGYLGTARAAHSQGATVSVEPAIGGGGSGGVTVDNTVDPPFSASTIIAAGATESAPDEATLVSPVSLLGPFAVAFNTPGLVNPVFQGIPLATLPDGAMVIRLIAIPTIAWAGGEATAIMIHWEYGNPADWDNTGSNISTQSKLLDAGAGPIEAPYDIPGMQLLTCARLVAPLNAIGLYITADGTGLESGAADIYALIATPA